MKCVRHKDYDHAILSGLEYAESHFSSHKEIAKNLVDKQPYTVTILIENLNPILWPRKQYCTQERVEIPSKYLEWLYQEFYADFGRQEAELVYRKWLDKYRPKWLREGKKNDLDTYIIEAELEPRYKRKIYKRFSDKKNLLRPRYRIHRERFYHLPEPLNHIDWRNPYDNIFVWNENGRKLMARGGSGSSGQREINSIYSYGYALINQRIKIQSALFIYDSENILWFIKRFSSLCLPGFDIGSNYHLESKEAARCLRWTRFLNWAINQQPIKEIVLTRK